MKRAAAAAVGRQCRGWRIERSAAVLATPLNIPICSATVQPSAAFSAFSRQRSNRRSSRNSASPRPPPRSPSPPPPPAVPARPRPKHAAPYPVTLDQIREYHKQQSFFSRLNVLRLRLHHTFQLILATQHTSPLHRTSTAVQAALNSTTTVFRSFAPFTPPFGRNLYHYFLTLHALTTPASAHRLLRHGLRAGLVGQDSVLAVMEGYARLGEGEKVREVMEEERGRGERVTVRMYEALLDGVKGDVDKLREIRVEMRQRGVKLSDKCWLLMFPAYTTNQPATAGLQQLLTDMSAEQTPVTANIAHAVVSSFAPSVYAPVVQAAGDATALDTFVLSQMEFHLLHPTAFSPEQMHHLLQSAPSLQHSSHARSMVLRAYARREHIHTGRIAFYDTLVIHQLLAHMAAQNVADDVWTLQVRMILAAQAGKGEEVLKLIEHTVGTFHPPASLFLPVLRSVAALDHSHRLTVLVALHTYLHKQRLSSQFSFALVLSLQSTESDIAGIRTTLATMKDASIPLTMHHWHQLLLSSPNTTQVTLLRDMMTKLHVLPSAFADAIVLSKQTTLRDAEKYYASLRVNAVSPHPLIRVAMADLYCSVGRARWACRQWWKVVSGSAEVVTKEEDESRDEWTAMGEVTEEEMDRILRQLQAENVGSRSDIHELRERIRLEQQTRRDREAAERQYYSLLLDLHIEVTAKQQQSEAERLATQQQHIQTHSLVAQRMHAQLARMEAGLQEEVLSMADSTLVKQFGELMRRMKARQPYAHMDILEHKKAEDEQAAVEEAEAARSEADRGEQTENWLGQGREEVKMTQDDDAVFVDLDEEINRKKNKQKESAAEGLQDHGRGGEDKSATPVDSAPPGMKEDEELSLMMEAARQLVASRSKTNV